MVSGVIPPNIRHVIAGIHIDESQVIRAGVVVLVAGKAAVGQVRIHRGLWLSNVIPKGIIASVTTGYEISIALA
jgi:hypothetical protein